jgi:hypothetical protein
MYNDRYVQQLERLIARELLPVYQNYMQERNLPMVEIPQTLLDNIRKNQQVPALLKPKEILP